MVGSNTISKNVEMKLIGITGSKGKTSSIFLLNELLKALGHNSVYISHSTKLPIHPSRSFDNNLTDINHMLSDVENEGFTHCLLEIDSKFLDSNINDGLQFSGVIHTNTSNEGFGEGNLQNNIYSKKSLFDGLSNGAFAIINKDDRRGEIMLQNCHAKKSTYGFKNFSDYKGKILDSSFHGLELEIDGSQIWSRLIGNNHAYNLLATYAAARQLGESSEDILEVLSAIKAIPNRFEPVFLSEYKILIRDIANNAHAIDYALKAINKLNKSNGKVITVLKCNDQTDVVMIEVAVKQSEVVIITNELHTSSTESIPKIKDILNQNTINKVLAIEDKKEAIKTACVLANDFDIILLSGQNPGYLYERDNDEYVSDDYKILLEYINHNN
ncbi:MAG TPA: Mur ligase family protein [Cyclobacteriaceae bacterium]